MMRSLVGQPQARVGPSPGLAGQHKVNSVGKEEEKESEEKGGGERKEGRITSKSVGRDRKSCKGVKGRSWGGRYAQNTLYEVFKYLVKKFIRGYDRIICGTSIQIEIKWQCWGDSSVHTVLTTKA